MDIENIWVTEGITTKTRLFAEGMYRIKEAYQQNTEVIENSHPKKSSEGTSGSLIASQISGENSKGISTGLGGPVRNNWAFLESQIKVPSFKLDWKVESHEWIKILPRVFK